MAETRTLILCADDYGIDAAACDAILELAALGRLSAVSCMSEAPQWRARAPALRAHAPRLLVGLHFNLTEPFGHAERPLGRWIARALAGAVDRHFVRARLERQVEAFVAALGRPPDYIDGHQHVHAFPAVREVVAEVAGSLPGVRVRNVARFFGRTDAPFKRRVIRTLATLGARANGALDLNTGFGGDYSLTPTADYAALFADWLASAPDGALLMCHPGTGSPDGRPSAARRELEFLRSDACGELLARHRVRLAGRVA